MKEYLGLVILLLIISYLMPNDKYQRYYQFVMGVLIAIVILQPVFGKLLDDNYWRMEKVEDILTENADLFGTSEEK